MILVRWCAGNKWNPGGGGGNVRDGDLEAFADVLEYVLIRVLAHKRDGEALGTEPTGTTDTVQVGVGVRGHVVVDGQVDALDVNTTTEDVGCDTDPLVELLELLVTTNTSCLSVSILTNDDSWSTYRSS